jgi:hypothetical protein
VIPVVDGMTLDFLQKEQGGSLDYGKERLHGAIGWGVTNMVLGPLISSILPMLYSQRCLLHWQHIYVLECPSPGTSTQAEKRH